MGQSQGGIGGRASDEQVDEMFGALQETFVKKSEEMGVDPADMMMKIRERADKASPSPMGVARISPNILDGIGKTPLVRINNLEPGRQAEVVAKVEFLNPGLSVKDRIALSMLEDGEAKGLVSAGKTTVIDITSGNTGIAWGIVCAVKGYKTIQIIPEPYSVERRALMMTLGVEVIVTAKKDGFPGALKKYGELLAKYGENGWSPRQFDNPANPAAHYNTTGPEIWEQTGGKVDVLVAAYGTGGTLCGTQKYLKEKNPDLLTICVEPTEQSLLQGSKPAPHGIQGIAPPFIPGNVKFEVFDELFCVPTAKAMETSRALAKQEGIASGISAGANVWVACQVAKREELKGKRIVTIIPSAAERYFSTPLYAETMKKAREIELAELDPEFTVEKSGVPVRYMEDLKKMNRIPQFKVVEK